jgi:uncharacterized protein YrrD
MTSGMRMLGREVVEEGSGEALGVVADVLFDDDCQQVLGLLVQRRRSRRRHVVIAFEALSRCTDDTIVAAAGTALAVRESWTRALPSTAAMQGKALITAVGDVLGTITDVAFDEQDGRVVAFDVHHRTDDVSRRRTLARPCGTMVIGDVIVLQHIPLPSCPQ